MELTPLAIDLTTLGIGASSGVRAEGLHASTIYGSFHADLDPKRYKRNEGSAPPPLLLETGLIFESILEEGLKRRVADSSADITRPGEFAHEDIYDDREFTIHYNPDLFIFNGEFRIGEIKATYMSSGLTTADYQVWAAGSDDAELLERVRAIPLEPKFDKWFTQMKLYCHMQQTCFARLYAWFVCGGYDRPFMPQFFPWDVVFSEDELVGNYKMQVAHANYKGML